MNAWLSDVVLLIALVAGGAGLYAWGRRDRFATRAQPTSFD